MSHNPDKRDWINSFYDSAVTWWGESWYDGENLKTRLDMIQKYSSPHQKQILELGAGTGETAAFLCERGYFVTAVDLSPKNIELLLKIQQTVSNFAVVAGDFTQIKLEEQFDIVCLFETFGLGSDRDQKIILNKISAEWLKEDGVVILDVYHPFGPIQRAGKKKELDRLENIPGSVDMTEYSYYDGIKNRWVDVWEPKNHPEQRQIQSIRCYTPADFCLLIDGTGLKIQTILFNGEEIDFRKSEITFTTPFENFQNNYAYTAILKKSKHEG